jgi:predicted HTH domain antitoxin
MITLKQFMEIVDYRITETDSNYMAQMLHLDYWDKHQDGVGASLTYDTMLQKPLCVTVCDYARNKAYRLKDKTGDVFGNQVDDDEYAWDDVKYIDLDTDNDFIEKAKAIVNYLPYDTRIEVELDLTNTEELNLMRMAHEADKTVNEFVQDILIRNIRDYEFTHSMFDGVGSEDDWVWTEEYETEYSSFSAGKNASSVE